jgi:hypothetical protein
VEVLAAHVWCDGEVDHSLRVERHRPEHIRMLLSAGRAGRQVGRQGNKKELAAQNRAYVHLQA